MRDRLTCTFLGFILVTAGCRGGRLGWGSADQSTKGDRQARTVRTRPSNVSQAGAAGAEGRTEPVSVLVINGDAVTVDDVLKPIRRDLEKRAQSMAPARYRKYLLEAIQANVRRLARDALLYHEASKGLTDEDRKLLDSFVNQKIRDRINKEFDGRRTRYERYLTGQGTTVDEERERVRRQLTVIRWLQMNITDKIVDPTRDQLWKVFESQRAALTQPPRRKMRLIEVSVLAQLPAGVSAPDDAQLARARADARAKAIKARSELLAGEDFGEVARAYSDGLHARSGGAWGWVTRGSVRRRWEPAVEALFALPACDVPSEVIETPDSFFIVEAARIDPGRQPDFQAVQPELVRRYREAEFNRQVEAAIARLQAKAQVRPTDIRRFYRAVALAAPQPDG